MKFRFQIKKKVFKLEYGLFALVLSLIGIGMIMLFSTSSVVGLVNYRDGYFFLKRYFMYLMIGCCAMIFGMFYPHTQYKKLTLPGLGLSFFLLFLTLVPGIGIKAGGANRWLSLGIIQFQPVEIVKFFIIVFFATALERKQAHFYSFRKSVLPLLCILAIPILILLKQPNYSNTLLILATCFWLMVLSGIPLRHLSLIGLMGGLIMMLSLALNPYQLDRVKTFLRPDHDPLGKGYHINQSLITIGSGGMYGLGIGQSKMKYFYLPLHYSDFIFSIVCEEGGLALALGVLGLFGLLFKKGFSISLSNSTWYSFLLGMGLTMILIFQGLINIAVSIGIFPVTGMPLTFISFGGTSLVMALFFVGVLFNIYSENGNRPVSITENVHAAR